MRRFLLFVAVCGLFCLTSCEKSAGSSGGFKNAVSILDKVIGQDIESAWKTVESFGIPFWEKDQDDVYEWEYVFNDGESDEDLPLVRLFVTNGIVYRAEYQLSNEGNKASCDNIIITWVNQVNNHKFGDYNVWFTYAYNDQQKMDDFSQLSNFIKNSNHCNVYFGNDDDTIGISINKEYEDNTFGEDFWFGVLSYAIPLEPKEHIRIIPAN